MTIGRAFQTGVVNDHWPGIECQGYVKFYRFYGDRCSGPE
jgi:hypothetical protein